MTGYRNTERALAALADGEIQILGGTAWLWSHEQATATVDTLFIDEAGQMSLATVLAVAPAARNVVLLWDPQQLDQPQKASHPDGVDVSALAHTSPTKYCNTPTGSMVPDCGGCRLTMPEIAISQKRKWRLSSG